MREKLEELLGLLDDVGVWRAGGYDEDLAKMRDLVIQLISDVDRVGTVLAEDLKKKGIGKPIK